MNKERILALADHIEGLPHETREIDYLARPKAFNMAEYCGSACCIAGWAVELFDGFSDWPVSLVSGRAKHLLGIEKQFIAAALFYPFAPHILKQITPQHAAATLRKLVETGEVQWNTEEIFDATN